MLTPRLPPPPRSVWKDAVSIQITAEIIHDHCNNHSTESCCRGQKSPYPISFHISHYYYSAPAFLPELKKKETSHYIWTLCLPGQIGDVDLISMSGTGGFVDDRSLLLVTLPFLCLWFPCMPPRQSLSSPPTSAENQRLTLMLSLAGMQFFASELASTSARHLGWPTQRTDRPCQ